MRNVRRKLMRYMYRLIGNKYGCVATQREIVDRILNGEKLEVNISRSDFFGSLSRKREIVNSSILNYQFREADVRGRLAGVAFFVTGIVRHQRPVFAEFNETGIGVVAATGKGGEFMQCVIDQPVQRRNRFADHLSTANEVAVSPFHH